MSSHWRTPAKRIVLEHCRPCDEKMSSWAYHIQVASSLLGQVILLTLAEPSAEAKVRDFGEALTVQENVGGLQVSVHQRWV